MTISSKKQSAGKLCHGNPAHDCGEGYDVVPGRDVEVPDDLACDLFGNEGVRLPVRLGEGRSSASPDMSVVYGDLLEKNPNDGLLEEKKTLKGKGRSSKHANPEANDLGVLDGSGSSKAQLKNTIKGEGVSSPDYGSIASVTSSRLDDAISEKTREDKINRSIKGELNSRTWLILKVALACLCIPLIIWGFMFLLGYPEDSDPGATSVSNLTQVVGTTQYHSEECG